MKTKHIKQVEIYSVGNLEQKTPATKVQLNLSDYMCKEILSSNHEL